MMYCEKNNSALALSEYLISKFMRENHPINVFELQKLLYCIQKSFLKDNKQAFEDDFEAWSVGPVVKEIYFRYNCFGVQPITLVYDGNKPLKEIDNRISKCVYRGSA